MHTPITMESYIADSADETLRLGRSFGASLPKNAVIALFGDLGAGKTTFIKGLVEGAGLLDSRCVSSPTFSLLNIYEGNKTIYHFDLYRLQDKGEFFRSGFDEYFAAGGICCMEWSEKIETELPINSYKVNISYLGQEKRQIEISRPKAEIFVTP